ncbi:winged-helix domain-containing protein [Pedobacter hiemivivus]|uniref:Ribonuclease R winged-helix domain-containing protein n=1 Tax=Pedobacter hiemivivus TaxID=2530454 RepID=A0A4R0NDN4_9SPHI|nr:winged-helix domain-containing protein [Pedobacter hiemivivus]TCC98509.1 hypothetical protein EZ444_04290 [Pedobacter hiemivivus]
MSIQTLYNPGSLNKVDLISSFVVRTKVFETIFDDISSRTIDTPCNHYLIQGQRGMGKTTLLLRLKYEVENTDRLNKWLIPIFFNEEMYDLTTLSRLWEKLLEHLDEVWETDNIHYEHTESFMEYDDYEDKCFEYLIGILRSRGQKIILFFDNFGQLFLDNLRDAEKNKLKYILEHYGDLSIIGASAIILNDSNNYAEPFYNSFKVIYLQGLNKEETFELISQLQENCEHKVDLSKNKAKIETLAILTGGVIRTLMMLYQVLLDDQNGTALKDLEIILDRVTPLYKHRIEDLPVQQRRIVDVIAKRWDAVSAKEIADNIRDDGKPLATKLVSAQLQQLEKNNVIEKKKTGTKNHLYQLKERFFNIWYLMRNGDRKDRVRVVWLTKFLELWYEDEDELTAFLHIHLKKIRSGKYHERSALLIAEALINSDKLNLEKQKMIYDETTAILADKNQDVLQNPRKRKSNLAFHHYSKKEYEDAVRLLGEITDRSVHESLIYAWCFVLLKDYPPVLSIIESLAPEEHEDVVTLAIIYMILDEPAKSLKLLLDHEITEEGRIFMLKADAYNGLKDAINAEKYYKLAILNFAEDAPNAYLNYSEFLIYLDRLDEAEQCLVEGINKRPELFLYKKLIDFYLFVKDEDKMYLVEANDILIKAKEVISNDPDLYFYEGIIQLHNEKSSGIKEKNHGTFFHKARVEYFRNDVQNYEPIYVDLTLTVCLIYYKDVLRDRKKVLKLLNDARLFEQRFIWDIVQVFLNVWDGKYGAVEVDLLNVLSKEQLKDSERERSVLNDVLLLLLSRKQYQTVLNIFHGYRNLQEILKPTYYALMTVLKKEYPNEIIKMGKELEEPVKDILARVETMVASYRLD